MRGRGGETDRGGETEEVLAVEGAVVVVVAAAVETMAVAVVGRPSAPSVSPQSMPQ